MTYISTPLQPASTQNTTLRSMKPRSVVFDLFGDHLRYHGGRAKTQALCDLLEVFGVGEATARVVLARMRREGWLRSTRVGRQVVYALSDKSWRLLDEGRERIFQRTPRPWDHKWRMVVYTVPEQERAERERLRKTLSWFGFGPLAPSTWVSPHRRLEEVQKALAETPAVTCHFLTCRSQGESTDLQMVQRCWDLKTLGRDYRDFIERLEALPPARELASLDGPDALRLQVQIVSGYRGFPFRDPDLPAELLPEGWPGPHAHRLFAAAHEALAAPAGAYVGVVLERHEN